MEVMDLHVEFDVFGGRLRVIDGVNITINPGERVGLVGQTGSGKTTLMKAIMRVLPMPPARITEGKILFQGVDINEMESGQLQDLRRNDISMIFQDPTAALNPVFTIGQQIGPVIRHADVRGQKMSKKEIRKLAAMHLKEVALADPERLLDSYPIQLSGGMKQRVCIAMALVGNRKLVIADEPGTSLDVTIQDQVLRLLQKLVENRDLAVILITHSLGVVRESTDRVYVMYAGHIVEVAQTKSLFTSPQHPYTQGLMDATPKLTGGGIAGEIAGRLPSYQDPPTGCRFNTRCTHVMDICRQKRPPHFRVSDNQTVACFLYDDFEESDGEVS